MRDKARKYEIRILSTIQILDENDMQLSAIGNIYQNMYKSNSIPR